LLKPTAQACQADSGAQTSQTRPDLPDGLQVGLISDEAGLDQARTALGPATICLIDIEGFALLTLDVVSTSAFELLFLPSQAAHPMHTEEMP